MSGPPPLPSDLLGPVDERFGLPRKVSSEFAAQLRKNRTAALAAIGSGAAGFIALGTVAFLKDPEVIARLSIRSGSGPAG